MEFIQLWNLGNLDELKRFLKNDVEVHSPNILLVYPELTEEKLVGREKVLAYWKILQTIAPISIIHLDKFEKNGHEICTISTLENKKEKLYVHFYYTEYGKISKLKFEYY